ncbi:MAG: cytochrome d ubiquinol oxidase subunit II [Myxococcales bacterium]|nr:cytochrome d ubiquinol oxidase subunit II [Myxococcales bacterium]
MDLAVLWFLLLGVLLAGYAVLDGFDFGVGILHPLARGDAERRSMVASIGPIWDGNEVWLVTFGGAMFAAFPEAYATVFSGFYVPFMMVLVALILRAVSLEFRSKIVSGRWRSFWDAAFFASSLMAALLFGTAIGTLMVGVPLNERGIFIGTLKDILFPTPLPFYPLLTGCLTVAMFSLHGGLYLLLKTQGSLHDRAKQWVWHSFGIFLVLYLMTTIVTLVLLPSATRNFESMPFVWIAVLLSVAAIGNIPRSMFARADGQAFLSSCALIVALVGLVGAALFPHLVRASNETANGLTIHDAASSETTLWIMTLIAGLGMPFVVAYTAVIYWTFRHRVDEDGY